VECGGHAAALTAPAWPAHSTFDRVIFCAGLHADRLAPRPTFEQKLHETWSYARAGDRLVAVQHRQEQSGSGLGQNFSGWTATTVAIR